MEQAFPFEETPDQLTAITDVKTDMEDPGPMDRLVFGDVGFGKTEVAMRAAFKAIQDGRQAAVLVPTTLLAQQHFQTFSERFDPYPVRTEMLSAGTEGLLIFSMGIDENDMCLMMSFQKPLKDQS